MIFEKFISNFMTYALLVFILKLMRIKVTSINIAIVKVIITRQITIPIYVYTYTSTYVSLIVFFIATDYVS